MYKKSSFLWTYWTFQWKLFLNGCIDIFYWKSTVFIDTLCTFLWLFLDWVSCNYSFCQYLTNRSILAEAYRKTVWAESDTTRFVNARWLITETSYPLMNDAMMLPSCRSIKTRNGPSVLRPYWPRHGLDTNWHFSTSADPQQHKTERHMPRRLPMDTKGCCVRYYATCKHRQGKFVHEYTIT